MPTHTHAYPNHRPRSAYPNARFWTYVNGSPVKLTLQPGTDRWHTEGGPTDEGYSYRRTYWHYELNPVAGSTIVETQQTEALDCDGRFESCASWTANPYTDLKAGPEDPDFARVVYPRWTLLERGQRDHSAEAMNY